MRRDPNHHSDELEPPPAWVNTPGYEYRAWRAFKAAEKEIRVEKRALVLVRAGERLATPEERAAVRLPPRRREGYAPRGLGPAVVATAVLIAWAVVAFLLFWFAAAILGF